MQIKSNGMLVYKLAGRSLAAARRLEDELRRELETVPVLKEGNLKAIGDSWNALYKGLLARLAVEAPEVLELTGLNARAVQVFQGPQTWPRAYAEAPHIFLSPEKNPEYFMYVPVDYKGGHFVPADGILLDEKEERITGDRLFAGGWLGNAPLVTVKKEGVTTPADYAPPSKSALRKAFSYLPNDYVCFIAAGRSLALVADLKARQKEWERRLKHACRAIEAAVELDKPKMLAALPAGEDVRISATYSYYSSGGGRAELLLSVRREGKKDFWSAGKTVPVPPSPAFTLEDRSGGEYIVRARTDTPEGRRLAAVIDAIPDTPGLGDYAALRGNFAVKKDSIGQALGVNGVVPHVVELAGRTILVYTAAPKSGKDGFCPPDAQPFSAFAYEWLRADDGDRNTGVTPPPMPQAVSDALAGKPAATPPRRKKSPPRP
ncbi:MAG: hypothetical protein KGL10_05460 [Alphaproteobacteria bacterium]|nr:hypothetical protein [Alphaproteobacteria bacterium]